MRARSPCQVRLEPPEDLHRALFYRDAFDIPVFDQFGHLRIPPPELADARAGEATALDGDWAAWWTDLFLRRRDRHDALRLAPLPRSVPESAELRRIVDTHEADFQRWWGTYPPKANAGQKAELAAVFSTRHNPEADLLAERGQAVLLTVDVLALDAHFTRAISRDRIVVSEAARHDPGYPDWLTRMVFPAS